MPLGKKTQFLAGFARFLARASRVPLTSQTGSPRELDALMVNLANQFGWRFAVCSFEKVKRFAQVYDVHVWFVAHPAKMHRDQGKIPVTTLYDISGSANWANKADYGIVVHRDWNEVSDTTEIYIRKVRFKSTGRVGVVSLSFDRVTGRYARAS